MFRSVLPLVGLLLIFLTACSAPGGPATPTTAPETTPQKIVSELSAAEVTAGPPQTISYPLASLYRSGAALPDADGLNALEELAQWLNRSPESRWQGEMAVVDGDEEQSLALANKRIELLQRFFARQGLSPEQLTWKAEATTGPELELKRLNGPS
jgi:hypothetical protein